MKKPPPTPPKGGEKMSEEKSPLPLEGQGEALTFWDHLDVLRSSLIRMAVAVCVLAIATHGRSSLRARHSGLRDEGRVVCHRAGPTE